MKFPSLYLQKIEKNTITPEYSKMDITCFDHHYSAFNLLLRAAETLLLFTMNMKLLLFQIKHCCYLILALKGFKSLTSAWHLEYFKIPLSKKKYLCKQEMERIKEKKNKSHEQPNNNHHHHHTKPKNTNSNTPTHLFGEHLSLPLIFFFFFQ